MTLTLEQRVEELEKKVGELSAGARKQQWRATFGMARDDSGFDEMVQLGQAYRKGLQLRDEKC